LGIKKSFAKMKPKEYLDKFIAEHPTASKKFKNAEVTESLVGLVPVSGPLNKTYADGVLLVGDAAGMTDALKATGLWSGQIDKARTVISGFGAAVKGTTAFFEQKITATLRNTAATQANVNTTVQQISVEGQATRTAIGFKSAKEGHHAFFPMSDSIA